MLRSRSLCTLVAAALLPAAVHAVPISYTFTSDVDSVGGAAAGSTSADVILVIDSAAADLDPSASYGEYTVDSASVEWSNGHVSTVSATGLLRIIVGGGWQWDQVTEFSNFGIQYDGVAFPFSSGTDDLVTSGSGPVLGLAVNFITVDDIGLVGPVPTYLSIASLPEPGALALLAVVGLGALLRRR